MIASSVAVCDFDLSQIQIFVFVFSFVFVSHFPGIKWISGEEWCKGGGIMIDAAARASAASNK